MQMKAGRAMVRVNLRSVAEGLPGVADHHRYPVRRLRELAGLDRFGQYAVVDDPDAADLIIYAESHDWDSPTGPYFEAIRRDPVYRRHAGRSFVHSGRDWPVPIVRGVFASIERGWNPGGRAVSGSYLAATNEAVAAAAEGAPTAAGATCLASFVGSVSRTPVRRALLALRDPDLRLSDNTAAFVGAVQAGDTATVEGLRRAFAQTLLDSRFVLCPRGYGTSSIRLFEAMQLGRCPVILSDAWVPPPGPAWDAFSLRVPERDVARLGAILRERAGEAEARGQAARAAWDEWFGPRVLFHRICQSCQSIRDGSPPEWATRWLCLAHFARPLHARPLLRRLLKRR
jgi:hypothetical protein